MGRSSEIIVEELGEINLIYSIDRPTSPRVYPAPGYDIDRNVLETANWLARLYALRIFERSPNGLGGEFLVGMISHQDKVLRNKGYSSIYVPLAEYYRNLPNQIAGF